MRRVGIAIAATAAPPVIAAALVLGWRDRLPDQLAVHWSLGAEPDDFTDRDGFLSGWLIAAVSVWVVGTIVALALRHGRRIAITITGAATGLAAAIALATGIANLDLADPRDARVGWESTLPLALMVITAGVAWLTFGRRDAPIVPAQEPPPEHFPRLASHAEAAYSDGHIDWVAAILTFAVMAGLGVVVTILLTPWLGAELIIMAAVVTTLSYTRVRVPRDDSIVFSAGPITQRVAVAELTGAQVRDVVEPFGEFGGRGLRHRPSTIGMVRRRGPGVDVGRTEGRRLVITSDDADRLARVLNTLADNVPR